MRKRVTPWRIVVRSPRSSRAGPAPLTAGPRRRRASRRLLFGVRELPHVGPPAAAGRLGQQHPPRRAGPPRRPRSTTATGRRFGLRGNLVLGSPCLNAVQKRSTGQASQRGLAGVQTSAPSSISAWLKSPTLLRRQQAAAGVPQPGSLAAVRGSPRSRTAGTAPAGCSPRRSAAGGRTPATAPLRGVPADAGQLRPHGRVVGQRAAVFRRDELRAARCRSRARR